MTTTSPPQRRYRLADHVRACQVDGQVILLDLQRGKYLGVGGAALGQISEHVADWPMSTSPTVDTSPHTAIENWVAHLLREGLLEQGSTVQIANTEIPVPLETMSDSLSPAAGAPGWRGLGRLIGASIGATHWLRRDTLITIAGRVTQMRAARDKPARSPRSDDLREAVARYHRLRPLIMTSHDKCLHDSLTMVRYLAAGGLYPNWVIGVRTRPFVAHSWVQAGDIVLNDLHERVRGFTPILVV